jgi:hypothetical protein
MIFHCIGCISPGLAKPSSSRKFGFIGLGVMGAPNAGQWVKGGHDVFVFTRVNLPNANDWRGLILWRYSVC